MLDDLHTAPLRSQRIKMAARQFIERYVGANDLAAVVHTSGRSDAGQEFTTSQSRLLRAVDKFMGRKLSSSTRNMIDDVQRRAGHADGRRSGRGHRRQGARLQRARTRSTRFATSRTTSATSAAAARRVVMFGEGIDYNINEIFSDHDHGSADGDRRDARHDRRRDARQRRDLRGRSARARRRVRRAGVDSVVPRRHVARAGHVVDLQRGAPGAGQPARDGRGNRRLRRRQPQRLRAPRSSASSTTTARTT